MRGPSAESSSHVEPLTVWPVSLIELDSLRAAGGDAMQHSFDADVLVNIWPVYSLTGSNDFKVVALNRRSFAQPPRPGQWHADHATVHELERNEILGNRNILNSGIGANRNAHAMPP
jgi:hypothetical protein